MNMKKFATITAFTVAVLISAGPAFAGVIISNPGLPPTDGDPLLGYTGPSSAVFSGSVAATDIFFSQFVNIDRFPDGPDEIQNYFATFTLTMDAGTGPIPVTLTGPVTTRAFNKVGNTTGMFDTEIIEMNLTGDIAGIPVIMREDPSLGSMGQTVIDDIGGGLYFIDSFFDVFTEVSIDGGGSFMAADGPFHMELVRTPEPATMSLLAMGGLPLMLRRKRNK